MLSDKRHKVFEHSFHQMRQVIKYDQKGCFQGGETVLDKILWRNNFSDLNLANYDESYDHHMVNSIDISGHIMQSCKIVCHFVNFSNFTFETSCITFYNFQLFSFWNFGIEIFVWMFEIIKKIYINFFCGIGAIYNIKFQIYFFRLFVSYSKFYGIWFC